MHDLRVGDIHLAAIRLDPDLLAVAVELRRGEVRWEEVVGVIVGCLAGRKSRSVEVASRRRRRLTVAEEEEKERRNEEEAKRARRLGRIVERLATATCSPASEEVSLDAVSSSAATHA